MSSEELFPQTQTSSARRAERVPTRAYDACAAAERRFAKGFAKDDARTSAPIYIYIYIYCLFKKRICIYIYIYTYIKHM